MVRSFSATRWFAAETDENALKTLPPLRIRIFCVCFVLPSLLRHCCLRVVVCDLFFVLATRTNLCPDDGWWVQWRRLLVYGITHFEQRQPQTKLPHPHKKIPTPRSNFREPSHTTQHPHLTIQNHPPRALRPRPTQTRAPPPDPPPAAHLPAARPDRTREKRGYRPLKYAAAHTTVSAVPDAHSGAALATTRPPAAAHPPRSGAC